MGFLDKVKKGSELGNGKDAGSKSSHELIDGQESVEDLICGNEDDFKSPDSDDVPLDDEKKDKPTGPIKNFKYLDDLIHAGSKEIVLDADIVLDDGEEDRYLQGIELDIVNLVIDGGGHSIDARGKTRIFKIPTKKVTIKNVTFKNGYGVKGGAIMSHKGILDIFDSNFLNNTADLGGREVSYGTITDRGGAIYVSGGVLNITRGYFEGNLAKDRGAAIDAYLCEANFKDVTFKNNELKNNSGTIFIGFYCEFTLKDILFENDNPLDKLDICNNGKLIILGKFSSNLSMSIINKKCIYVPKMLIDSICNKGKIYEIAEDAQGDFRYLDGLIRNADSEIKLDRDIMLNIAEGENKTYIDGIIIDKENLIIDGMGHTIDAYNLSRIFKIHGKNITIRNIKLKNGYAEEGSAIYSTASLNIYHSTFISNIAKSNGGAIYQDGIKLIIEESSFRSCRQKDQSIRDGGGGAIHVCRGNIRVLKCEFLENSSSDYGGAIWAKAERLKIIGSLFKDNSGSGAALCASCSELVVEDSTFKSNQGGYFGALTCFSKKMTIKNSSFTDNSGTEGGAILISSVSKSNISNCSFCYNDASKGGAICANNSQDVSTIENSTFINNHGGSGGAIHCSGSIEIINSRFFHNSAFYGGAIEGFLGFKIYIKNSRFTNNRASYGGALSNGIENNYYDSFPGCKITIDDSVLSNNKSKKGGAIVNDCGILRANSCDLSNNVAEEGGAIYVEKNDYPIRTCEEDLYIFNISKCSFTDNQSDDGGGAIYNGHSDYFHDTGDIIIKDSTFKNNTPDNVRKGQG